MAVLISGIPSHPVKDVQISNLSVRLAGGGKVEDAKVRLPENEADYPEVTMFGKVMPVSGMYIRHAEKVSVEKVRIEFEQPDFRPAIGGIVLYAKKPRVELGDGVATNAVRIK